MKTTSLKKALQNSGLRVREFDANRFCGETSDHSVCVSWVDQNGEAIAVHVRKTSDPILGFDGHYCRTIRSTLTALGLFNK